ncbi:MAG: hypothetical protein IV090_22060 [Candidatus Sericytochromatia bacterium]|nr:hypothetical protein [Candidatus Sericytochromatia bacterium]
MEKPLIDTTPVTLKVSGTLSLHALIQPQACGAVLINGHVHVGLSKAVDKALGFLPWLIRTQIKGGLIQRRLEGTRFHFVIPNLFTLITDVSSEGVLNLEKRYHIPLVRPIAQNETHGIFKAFGKGLAESGLKPYDPEHIDVFLSGLRRKDQGNLPFLALFEGKGIHTTERQTPSVEGLELQDLRVSQDKAGDLLIEFDAKGRLQGH